MQDRPNAPHRRSALPRMHRLAAALGMALSVLVPAQAQSLAQLYETARSYDAAYRSAQLQYEATVAKAEQSRAGILPTVGLAAQISRTAIDANVPIPSKAFGTQGASISASQPLYRPANRLTYEQGKKSLIAGQAQLETAEQDLIVRLSQAYFDVLAARDGVTFIEAQKTAVAEQLAAAKRNFEVGTSTITDTREAQARFDLVRAQEIAADNDLRVKQLALNQLVGRDGITPKPPAVLPLDVNAWVNQAVDLHPLVRQATVALEVAQLETRKAQAGERPTVDLTGSYAMNHNDGTASSRLDSRTNVASIGVSLNFPLFAGYAIQNRIKETLALEEKARSDLDTVRRSVSQATRAAYFGVLSGQGQAQALEAAEASSQSSLDANKLGYQVGVRINIDVLNAQSQLYQTKRDLARARYDVLVGGLRLRQANGSLTASDLQGIEAILAK